MKYRRFGRLEWEASVLGFGAMRLPTRGGPAQIDEPEATRMLRLAIDRGVNYLDTAYPYHGGQSEAFLGRALQEGYREKVRIATKLPVWLVDKRSDCDRFLAEQLRKLQVDHIDFYLLHGLNENRWEKLQRLDVLSWAEKARSKGLVGSLGFSFHDKYPVFKRILDEWDGWSFCQIQYNYMNEKIQAGTRGLEDAARKGLAVVIMEPLLGGSLASAPEPVQKIWDSASVKRSPVDWALQWLWSKEEVTVVLSGMSTLDQVKENLASAGASEVGLLGREELDLVRRVRDAYEKLRPVTCTSCEYCLPCPNGVNIPRVFEIYNYKYMYANKDGARQQYSTELKEEERAGACTQCQECEEKCPQKILISSWMPRVSEELEPGSA